MGMHSRSTTQSGCGLRRVRRVFAAVLALGLSAAIPVAYADYIVPANASTSLNGARLNLACTDLIIGGSFSLGGGTVTGARNVIIQAGGTLDGGSGTISLAGNFANSGSFVAGTGSVNFVDIAGCASTGMVSGNNGFYNLSVVTTAATGKTYAFAVGSTQLINHLFTLQGTAAGPLQLTSSVAGQPAFINLPITGAQSMASLGVVDLVAIGVELAPNLVNLAPSNGASAIRWFGATRAIVVPTLSGSSLLALAILLMLFGCRAACRPRTAPFDRTRS